MQPPSDLCISDFSISSLQSGTVGTGLTPNYPSFEPIIPKAGLQAFIDYAVGLVQHCSVDGSVNTSLVEGEVDPNDGGSGSISYGAKNSLGNRLVDFAIQYRDNGQVGCLNTNYAYLGDKYEFYSPDKHTESIEICWDRTFVCHQFTMDVGSTANSKMINTIKTSAASNQMFTTGGGDCGWENATTNEKGDVFVYTQEGSYYPAADPSVTPRIYYEFKGQEVTQKTM